MQIYLIRHGKTAGNLEKRYIGCTDEPLCELGRKELEEKKFDFQVEKVFVSPLLRCRETAQIIWKNSEQIIIDDFRECNFGLFENKNYQELSDCPQYQKWVDSMGRMPFPHGESKEVFSQRCVKAFSAMVERCRRTGVQRIAVVVHGGTIMAIMEKVAVPSGNYYDFQVKNGEGFLLTSCEGGFVYDCIC